LQVKQVFLILFAPIAPINKPTKENIIANGSIMIKAQTPFTNAIAFLVGKNIV